MRREGLAIAWGLIAALSCGGQVDIDVARRSADVPSPVGVQQPDAGVDAVAVRPIRPPVNEAPELVPFIEPGCPPVSTQPDLHVCDPLGPISGCAVGESCFPFVRYPSGPCEVENFGTMCTPAGRGTQGDSCSMELCAADHICVSTGRGTQCARLCGFGAGAPSVCAPGLLCLPIDIEGFGGCL